MNLDLYVSRESLLHRADPRVKLWAALLGMVFCLAIEQVEAQIAFLAAVNGTLLAAKVPWDRIRWVWARMLPVTVLILILQPWVAPGGAVWLRLGPLALTSGGVASAALFAARVNALAFAAALPLLTTPPDRLVRGMVRLGMPYTWGLTVSLALRYLPTAYALFTTIRQAQEARGHVVTRGRLLARLRSYLPALTATIIASLRLSDQLAMAMTARGLGRGPRTVLYDIAMTRTDWLLAAAVTAGFMLFLAC